MSIEAIEHEKDMKLHLTHAEFRVVDEPDRVLSAVEEAVTAEGFTWEPTGATSAVAAKGAPDRDGPRPTGSAKTQIDVRLHDGELRTRRLSKGNHKGFVGVVQVQQDHRRVALAIRRALTRADLLRSGRFHLARGVPARVFRADNGPDGPLAFG